MEDVTAKDISVVRVSAEKPAIQILSQNLHFHILSIYILLQLNGILQDVLQPKETSLHNVHVEIF